MRRPIIGHLARAAGTIPVERPQDLAKPGKGTITEIKKGKILMGLNTEFLKDINVGDSLLLQGLENEFIITSVISDSVLEFKTEEEIKDLKIDKKFKIQPKVDQSSMFEYVWQALRNNDCIGIFPEGGSHDRTELLPLKAGICIMALGAMQKYKKPVYLQPVGLNYFQAHKFRSKVIVDFGIPKLISEEMIQLYQTNKRQAIGNLLKKVEQYLLDVTITAQLSYSKMSALYLTRSIYLPENKHLSRKEGLELIRRFGIGFKTLCTHPEIIEMQYKIKFYEKKLKYLGIHDFQVRTIEKNPILDLLKFLYSLIMTIGCFIFFLPGLIMSGPIALILEYLGEKERKKALANSKVKIQGKDVVASYKILSAMVIVPIAVFVYTLLFYYYISNTPTIFEGHEIKISLMFLFLWPLYVSVMVRSSAGLIRHARTVKTRLIFFFSENTYVKLKKTREQLQQQIRDFVHKYGNTVIPGFDNQRIVNVEEFDSDFKLDRVFECLTELGI